MHKITKRRLPLARSLLAVALAQVLVLPSASAQETSPEQDKTELDTVFVTGSRIKRLDGETALPVEIITRADIRFGERVHRSR